MTQELFISAIASMREQSDKDIAQATKLADIYGADINPNDNSNLTDVIFEILFQSYPNSVVDINHFCFEQDFGRSVKKTPFDLWESVVMNLSVDHENEN